MSPQTGAAQRRTVVTPSRGEGAGGRVVPGVPHGRPKGRRSTAGAAQRRTVVTPALGAGAGGRVVQ